MPKAGFIVTRVCFLVLAASMLAFFAVPSQVARASTSCPDCYIVITPATNPAIAGAGTGDQYAFQVTNDDPHEALKSLTFTAPADFVITGFVITGASGPSGTSASTVPASSVTLNLPGNAGSSFAIDITALAPCVPASSEVWAVSGTDSLGETGEVKWSSGPLSVSVQRQCSLQFAGQPAAETPVNSDILTGSGSALAVQLFDANEGPLNLADFSANGTSVMTSIEANPGGGSLAGTTTVTTSNGVAHFGNLQINKPGTGYTLSATSSGIISGTSDPFTIVPPGQPCPSATACSGSASSATTSGTVTTTSPVPGAFIQTGISGARYTCGTYTPVSDAFSFALFNAPQSTTLTGTLTIDKSLVQSSGHPGASSWQLCYASTQPFTPRPGTILGTASIGGVTFDTGLLPDCSGTQGAPCVEHRNKNNAGNVVVTFLALGDPLGRG